MFPGYHPRPECLLIDADDTLWENNIYFERVIENFIAYLNHAHYSSAEIRSVLHEVGLRYIESHGYGTRSFARALVDTCEHVSKGPLTGEVRDSVCGLAEQILEQPVELIPGVHQTLDYLAGRHRLILMTKGDVAEQTDKVDRSGLKQYFSAIEIVVRKNLQAYNFVAEKHGLRCHASWMIGNSPRSDINPALEAGMNAVYVPHRETSMFERESLGNPSGKCRLLQLQSFSELRRHF